MKKFTLVWILFGVIVFSACNLKHWDSNNTWNVNQLTWTSQIFSWTIENTWVIETWKNIQDTWIVDVKTWDILSWSTDSATTWSECWDNSCKVEFTWNSIKKTWDNVLSWKNSLQEKVKKIINDKKVDSDSDDITDEDIELIKWLINAVEDEAEKKAK